MTLSLVVLAGGRATRFGRSKQIEPVGPDESVLLEYAIFDALRAGFDEVVVVVAEGNIAPFQQTLSRVMKTQRVHFVEQILDTDKRSKPWGTAHAVLAAQPHISDGFAVINADDYYGPGAFELAAQFLRRDSNETGLLAYRLDKTVHNANPVSRALCEADPDDRLESLREMTVSQNASGAYNGVSASGTACELRGQEWISMNFWLMSARIIESLQSAFETFRANEANPASAEFALPDELQKLLRDDDLHIALLKYEGESFGLSHPGDKALVVKHLQALHDSNDYPLPLWP